MAIKRQSATPKTPPARRRSAGARPAETQPLYSADEKRQLILAHAAMREPQDPLQAMSAWAGVLIAVAVVAIGWWWSSGSVLFNNTGGLGQDMVEPFKGVANVFEQGKQDAVNGGLMKSLKSTSDQLRVMQAQAASREQALNDIAGIVSSTTVRGDLFNASATTTTPTSSKSLSH